MLLHENQNAGQGLTIIAPTCNRWLKYIGLSEVIQFLVRGVSVVQVSY